MKFLSACYVTLFLSFCTTNVAAQKLSTPLRPWYATFQLSNHDFEVVIPGHAPFLTGIKPYQFSIGRWLTPRWGVQVGFSAYHFLSKTTAIGTTETGEPSSRYFYAEAHVRSVPLLLRYHLTRNVAHRLQFDGSLGMTFVHYNDKFEVIEMTNGQTTFHNNWGSRTLNTYLTLGPSVSYQFSQHFEGCFDFLLTKNLRSVNRTFSTQQLNSTLGFQRGWNLGVRYRFSTKKQSK